MHTYGIKLFILIFLRNSFRSIAFVKFKIHFKLRLYSFTNAHLILSYHLTYIVPLGEEDFTTSLTCFENTKEKFLFSFTSDSFLFLPFFIISLLPLFGSFSEGKGGERIGKANSKN